VPQANDDAPEKPGTMAQDLARSPGTGGADADTSDQHPDDQHFGYSARSSGPALFAGG